MKKMLVIICLILCIHNIEVLASDKTVNNEQEVYVVDFPININYEDYNNPHEYGSNIMSLCEYPMISYKDIIYIPLTYYNCILLGLDIEIKDNRIILRKANFEAPAEYLKEQLLEEKKGKTIFMKNSPFVLEVQGVEYDDEYPTLFYKNIVYLPLTWNVVNDIMQWDYSFSENGIELYTDSYYFYSEGDSLYELKEHGGLSAYTPYGKTYYRKNGKEVFAETYHLQIGGPRGWNMTVFNGNDILTISGYTGYGQKQGPLFTVNGEYIYTVHSDGEKYAPCKIKIETGEIIYTNGKIYN